jgi:hypothetical protein
MNERRRRRRRVNNMKAEGVRGSVEIMRSFGFSGIIRQVLEVASVALSKLSILKVQSGRSRKIVGKSDSHLCTPRPLHGESGGSPRW